MGLKKYYSPKKAIKFFREYDHPDFDEHDLLALVTRGQLNPCFHFVGTLTYHYEQYHADRIKYEDWEHQVFNDAQPDAHPSNPCPYTEAQLKVNFTGYLTPESSKQSINLSKLEKFNEFINEVRAIESVVIELTDNMKNYVDMEMNIDQFNLIKNDQTAVFDINGEGHPTYKYGRGLKISSKNCLFSLAELEKLVAKNEVYDTEQSHEDISKIAEFEPAVLNALAELEIDPKAMPPYNPKKPKDAVRGKVKKKLLANIKTAHLASEDETFNKYWQDLRNQKILVDKL